MTTLDEKTITVEDKTYYYDPDYDCYYRRYTRQELGHWDTYGWIYAIVLLAALAVYISYLN
jgi:hypothetical protein